MIIFDPPGITAPSSKWREYAGWLDDQLRWIGDDPEDQVDKARLSAELSRAREFATVSLVDGASFDDETLDEVIADRFDPNQPRDPAGTSTGGQWTAAGGHASENVVALTSEAKTQMAKDNEGKDLDQIVLEAGQNQIGLRKLGSEMQEALDVRFVEPPKGYEVKSRDSIVRKVSTEGYAGPHELRDISRATFVVPTASKAELVIGALGGRGKVYDRGWTRDVNSGYIARFVYLQHPNGGVSEIQIVPDGVAQIKMGADLQSNGPGHVLYEIMRRPTEPLEVRRVAARKSRTMYNRVLHKSFYEPAGVAVGAGR